MRDDDDDGDDDGDGGDGRTYRKEQMCDRTFVYYAFDIVYE